MNNKSNKAFDIVALWLPIAAFFGACGTLLLRDGKVDLCHIEAAAMSAQGNGSILGPLLVWSLIILARSIAFWPKLVSGGLFIAALFVHLSLMAHGFSSHKPLATEVGKSFAFSQSTSTKGDEYKTQKLKNKGCKPIYDLADRITFFSLIVYVLGALLVTLYLRSRDPREQAVVPFNDSE